MKRRHWTTAEVALLRHLYPSTKTAIVAERLGRSLSTVCQKAQKLRLKKTPEYLASSDACRLRRGDNTGAATRFARGVVPWNKGTHFVAGGRSAETRFKPGNLSGRAAQRIQPIGALRINGDGYLDRKMTTAGRGAQRWTAVHRLVWEEANGPVPRGSVVVFRPGRRSTELADITLDALELVTRRELMMRNTVQRLPKEIVRVVQLRGALMRKINERTRA
jgi:hypothetical protein